jgi:hypothetical protein
LQLVVQHGVQHVLPQVLPQVLAHGLPQGICLTTVRGTIRQQTTVCWQGTHLATMRVHW